MAEALDGLPWVLTQTFEPTRDEFRVTYDPERGTVDRLSDAIETLGYRSSVVTDPIVSGARGAPDPPPRLDAIRGDLQAAGDLGVPLLLLFEGPGCPACVKMKTQTYADAAVARSLGAWRVRHVDVAEHPELAAAFGVRAIPAAIAVDSRGEVLEARAGFADPATFVAWLDEARHE